MSFNSILIWPYVPFQLDVDMVCCAYLVFKTKGSKLVSVKEADQQVWHVFIPGFQVLLVVGCPHPTPQINDLKGHKIHMLSKKRSAWHWQHGMAGWLWKAWAFQVCKQRKGPRERTSLQQETSDPPDIAGPLFSSAFAGVQGNCHELLNLLMLQPGIGNVTV